MLEDFLPLVTKPARYINNEINSVHKDLSKVKSKVCLFFPDTYEIGMSHLGLRILYHILNSREDTACERVFSPWTDYEQRLRLSGRPLASLESHLPLLHFDIIGITLQYELSYTNILAGLELGGIPLHANNRSNHHPVIIAGGPCAVNPEPLSDFIDAFFIGDGEDAIQEIVDLKQKIRNRNNFLIALSEREGFYVPSLNLKNTRRRIIRNLNAATYPSHPMIPLMKPIHDRVTVEVARGCIHGCRFCQAGMIYRPYRERSGEKIKALIQKSLHCTGYDELSLASLSTGDHSNIQPLMMELAEQYKEQCISISLPSLRVGTLTPEMIKAIAETRKTGFTLAPEAGTERLRRVINKPVSDHDLMDCAKTIFDSGWNILKLYFMIGLPTETWEDLDGIIRLTNDLLNLGKRISKRHVQLNVSVSTFVPKPHTPFQWVTQATLVEIRKKQEYLEKGLKKRGITIKTHNSEASLLEGVFARGERALGMVIEEAVRLGCRFDGWTESFNFNKWRDAFQKYGLDISDYASRIFRREDQLPWSHILSGVTIEHLKSEYEHAFAAEITENCRINCSECGIECDAGGMASLGKSDSSDVQHEIGKTATLSHRQGIRTKGPRHSNLIRLKYTKVGRVRFLSHLDLMTVFQRAVMRTEIPILFSQGFNPHPKVAFGPALAVGMESEAEYLDMEIDAFGDTSKITNVLNTALPEGIRILEIRIIPPGTPSLSNSICRYIYEVDISSLYSNDVDTRIQMFLSQSSVIVERNGKRKDIRPAIESIALTRDSTSAKVDITIQEKQGITARPQDIIENLFGVGSTESSLFNIRRTAMYINDRGSIKSPLDIV